MSQPTSAAGGDTTSQSFLQQQQQELQAKILSILNGSSAATAPSPGVQSQTSTWAGGATAVAAPAPRGVPPQQQGSGGNPLINFDNPNVQKALDNLIQSGPNLLKNIPVSTPVTRPGFSSALGAAPATRAPLSQQAPAQQGYGGYQQQQQQQQPQQQSPGVGGPRMMGYGTQQQSTRPMAPRAPQQSLRPRY